MASQTTVLFKETPGSKDVVLAQITLDDSYPAGGYPIPASVLKAGRIRALGVVGCNKGYDANFDSAAGTIVVTYSAPAGGSYPDSSAPVFTGADLTGVVVTVLGFVE